MIKQEHFDLPKAYDPKQVDPSWYKFWTEEGFFTANPDSQKPPFCIVIPPPNVTGVLHMGHALVNTLQDILSRWKRMLGFEVLWVPGTDHAGIATQTIVEKHLFKTLGKKRADFSREEFLKHAWKWKEDNEHIILNQLKKLGCSCDFTKTRFTLDPGNNLAVRKTFKNLYDQGLIYRGNYLVNWDTALQTALADDEVEYEERQGFLWVFRYPLEDGQEHISIATTRPETMLGDTAIAVSPKDHRYRHLIGKKVLHPLTQRLLPILADPFIDPAFGTGAMKITPAHDPEDYKLGLEHQLDFINIMTEDGKVNAQGGPFSGMTFAEAREAVINAMKTLGLFIKAEPHVHRVGVSYRSKVPVEPYLSKQWFVKLSHFAPILKEMVQQQKVKLVPANWENTYFHWIDNLRDWCISRQLVWGHRIPVWYNKQNPEVMLCEADQEIPEEVKNNPEAWVQDPDVLDTWFSSALWPFAALGWPERGDLLSKFYPNSTLVTGYDILFFWVARMLAMGQFVMGKPPFPEVFLHGLIYGKSYWRETKEGGVSYVAQEERKAYDSGQSIPSDVKFKWEKMSKSKGNVIDPLEVIDEYGTDAIRMALAASCPQSREIDLDQRRFEEFRNFANKIWNGARFVLMNLGEEVDLFSGFTLEDLGLEDKWILSKLQTIVQQVNTHLETYEFDSAALKAYDFFWKEFCAYYVEFSKPYLFNKIKDEKKIKPKILSVVLCQMIRLLHPMAPFITEELFQILKKRFVSCQVQESVDPLTLEMYKALQAKACAVAPYPVPFTLPFDSSGINQEFENLQDVIYTIRNVRGEMKLAPHIPISVTICGQEKDPHLQLIERQRHLITALIKIDKIDFTDQDLKLPLSCTGFTQNLKIVIPLPQELLQAEKNRLEKEAEKLMQTIEKLQSQLANAEFIAKAPAALIEKQQHQLQQAEKTLQEIRLKTLQV